MIRYTLKAQRTTTQGTPRCRWCGKPIHKSGSGGLATYIDRPEGLGVQFHSNGCAIQFAHSLIYTIEANGSVIIEGEAQ